MKEQHRYGITLTQLGVVDIQVNMTAGDGDVDLVDDAGKSLDFAFPHPGRPAVLQTVHAAGTLTLVVAPFGSSETASYTLQVARPALKALAPGPSGPHTGASTSWFEVHATAAGQLNLTAVGDHWAPVLAVFAADGTSVNPSAQDSTFANAYMMWVVTPGTYVVQAEPRFSKTYSLDLRMA